MFEHGVRHIPDKLAYGCTGLKQVVLPDTLESVGRHALEYTPFLESWRRQRKNSADGGRDVFWDGTDAAGDFRIPDGTRIVAGGAFYGNRAITSVSFPESVSWIGPAALKGCESLCRAVWPGRINAAEAEVFSGCVNLTKVCWGQDEFLPVPWQTVKERAFYNCRSLGHISLEHVQSVGKEAFKGCSSFRPQKADALRQVGDNAFEHTLCDDNSFSFSAVGSVLVDGRRCLGRVDVPEGITAIGPFAFAGRRL